MCVAMSEASGQRWKKEAGGLGGPAADVTRVLALVEPDFLAVGEELDGAIRMLGPLIASFGTLPQSLDNPDLKASAADLLAMARTVGEMAGATKEELAGLVTLEHLNMTVSKRIEDLRKTVATIAMLGFNAKIEAASADDDGSFTSFIGEIMRLSEGAAKTITDIKGTQTQLRDVIVAAIERQKGFETRHRETLGRVAQDLETALSLLATRNIEAARAAADIETRADQIRRDIGSVIIGLQLSDSLSQRLTHVTDALGDIGQGPAAVELLPWICRLEAAHVGRSAVDFDSGIVSITEALTALGRDTRDLVTSSEAIYGGGTSPDTVLCDIEGQLQLIMTTMDEWYTARVELDRVVSSVGVMVADLLGQVGAIEGVEVAMRLVGLNTMFKCGRLGDEGRALRVIAQELRRYAHQTKTYGDILASALSDIATASDRFSQLRGTVDTAHGTVLEQRITTAITPFRAAGMDLGRALGALRQDGEQVTQVLDGMAAKITGRRGVVNDLRHFEAFLTERAHDASSVGSLVPEVVELLRQFGWDRYTMAIERDVHDQFLVSHGLVGGASVGRGPGEKNLDDVFF